MSSFGSVKNSLGKLDTLGKSMGLKKHLQWPQLDEKSIKEMPIAFYLQVLGYVVTEYSPTFYAEVLLEEVPNIATLQDTKFIGHVLNISRRQLAINPIITPQQFLHKNKWVEKKLKFLVDFCEKVQQWESANGSKGVGRLAREEKIKTSAYESREGKCEWGSEQEEDDDLEVRQIKVQPTVYEEVQHIKPNFGKETIPNEWEEPVYDRQTLPRQQRSVEPKKLEVKAETQVRAVVAAGSEAVTRQEYDQLVTMLSAISSTQTELVSKFNDFQNSVVGWVNNLTAKVTILQENVKTIKQNL